MRMVTTYKLNTRELEISFLDSIKSTYPERDVKIMVWEQDETEYLLNNPANRERMERILAETKEGKLVTFNTLDDAMQRAEELTAAKH